MEFKKSTKEKSKARIVFIGPSGSGKTYSSLCVATEMARIMGNGTRIGLIDTERGSASKYADLFDFDVLELDIYHPNTYIKAIKIAEEGGYGILIVDSLSHAWVGKQGVLDLVDKIQSESEKVNKFTAWRTVTPLHNALVDTLVGVNCHLIGTIRSKMEYVLDKEDDGRGNQKTVVRKVGMSPIQRDDFEYEFDVVGDMDLSNTYHVSATRCPELHGKVIVKPGNEFAETIMAWLYAGVENKNNHLDAIITSVLLVNGVCSSTKEANDLLALSNLPKDVHKDIVKAWGLKYLVAKSKGLALDNAIEYANEAYTNYLSGFAVELENSSKKELEETLIGAIA